jgi:hypothetical protein
VPPRGRSKTTIAKAVRSGKLSAARRENGDYEIDPAELSRVYPVMVNGGGSPVRNETPEPVHGAPGDIEVWRALAIEREETIRDLRARLDAADARTNAEAEERRKLIAILTDQRRRPWWRRWLR